MDEAKRIEKENESLLKEYESYLQKNGYAKKTVRLYVHSAGAYINYIIDGTDSLMDDSYEGSGYLTAVDGVSHIRWYLDRLYGKFDMSLYGIGEEARGIKVFYKWMEQAGKIGKPELKTAKMQVKEAIDCIE